MFTVTSTTGFYNGMPISFTTTGALPTGLTASTTYYVTNLGTDGANKFRVSATLGGADVNTSSSGSGTHTSYPLVPINNTTVALSGLTFSRSTSTPMIGAGQGSLVQTNSTVVAGQGVAYPFTIDTGMRAQVLSVRFTFNASSTFVASSGQTGSGSDIEVAIWDVNNSVLIPVSPKVITANGSNYFQFNGTFQTASNSTSYSLVLYTPTMNANATGWTFLFDSVYVGPQNMAQGAPVTDWVAYTPTFTGFGTVTAKEFYYRRVGDTIEIAGDWTNGTVSATEARISLPTGFTSADTTKITSIRITGNRTRTTVNAEQSTVLIEPSVTYFTFGRQTGAVAGITKQNGDAIFNTGEKCTMFASCPIQGWSSNVQMSNDTSSSVVAARGYRSAALSGLNPNNTSVKINLDAANGDTNGAWDTANSKYVIPVSGWYQINCAITINSTNVLNAQYQTVIYKNGSLLDYGQSIYPPSTNGFKVMGSYLGQFVAGDYLELYLYGAGNNSASTLTAAVGATNVYMEVQRVSGPSTIAVTDTVACSYWASANTSTSTSTPVNFDSKVFDTTGSVTTGSGWKFTAPISGKYLITGYVNLSGTGGINGQLYKNGSTYSVLCWLPTGAAESFSYTINLLAGDYIDIRTTGAATITGNATQSNAASSNIQISRIGN